ncbi:MAG: ParB/RepB/Spo0J family partition protein [Trueperaceae bacterium]|nr:ParB/RepB/Spo0J family partition protein [Trueperaceae bacterium]
MSAKRRRTDLDRAAVFEAILGDLGGAPEEERSVGTVPIDEIVYNERQPRQFLDPIALAQLTTSIRERGVLEPVLVRRVGDRYELVAGERRTRAAREAGLDRVPAIVLELDDREALEISIMENLQREDLNAVEETEAVLQLLQLSLELDRAGTLALLNELIQEARGRAGQDRFAEAQKAAAAALFERLGRFTPASFLANRVPILTFPEELLEAVRSGRLAFTKAQALARVEDAHERQRLLDEAIQEQLSLSQIRRRITEVRADVVVERTLGDEVIERMNATRRLLQRKHVARLDDARLGELRGLLDRVVALIETEPA